MVKKDKLRRGIHKPNASQKQTKCKQEEEFKIATKIKKMRGRVRYSWGHKYHNG
ncbi:MAG: hypothetical protein ACI4MQ_03910 [Candidatus Coproplasma sp.]